MKQIIKKSLQSLLLVPAIVLGVSLVMPAAANAATTSTCSSDGAATGGIGGGAKCAQGTGTATDLFGSSGIFKTIVNVLLYVIGAIAVIMLIIGGVRYVVSGGDSGAVTSAKNTILYAVVGIIIAILAFAIVNFVIGSVGTGGNPSTS